MKWGRWGRENTTIASQRMIDRTRIDPHTECWVWFGARGSQGRYGTTGMMGKSWLAHRAMWFLFTGEDPGDSCICHKCDNGLCINPAHLFKGTQGDNVRDMEDKKRSYHPSGESHGRAKLTAKDVKRIRRLKAKGMATRAIARLFPQVSRTVVHLIIKNRIWLTT